MQRPPTGETLGNPPPSPPGLAVQADALRAAFPDYQVSVTSVGGEDRIEVVRQRGDGGPWCLISTDAREIWQELKSGS
jgi:hypothetical protein